MNGILHGPEPTKRSERRVTSMNSGSCNRRRAFTFIILLGVVSLFADMTYEGAHAITGPYLSLLGASAATVGFVGGAGELMRYSLRLVSGYVADRTQRYWLITILGYGVNLLAVPLLALAGRGRWRRR